MREPTRYEKIIWWLESRWHDLVRKSTGQAVWFMQNHPKFEQVLKRLLPVPHLWVWARYEWEVGQTMNDGPDEYYWLWPKYWELVSERNKVKCH